MRAMALYYFLNRHDMNISRIISSNMDERAQSQIKKSLGYATVIHLLCRKIGVPKFRDGHIMNPTRPLDVRWITKHPMRIALTTEEPETKDHPEDPIGPTRPQSQYVPDGVPLADEDSQGHRDRMSMLCFMQPFCAHTGLLGRYLTHQVDTWVVV